MMELNDGTLKVPMGTNMEGLGNKEFVDPDIAVGKQAEDWKTRCSELEQMNKHVEQKCASLELEVWKKKSELELLESKFGELKDKKRAMEVQLWFLKKRNDDLEKQISRIVQHNKALNEGEEGMGRIVVNMTEEKDEEDKILQLVTENKVLDCEKRKAESDVEVWKLKHKDLETQLLELEKTLCLSCKKHRLAVASTVDSRSSELGKEEMGGKDSLDVATRSTHLKMENNIVDCDQITHAVTGVGSSCFQPVKGTADLQASAGTPSFDFSCKPSTHIYEWKQGLSFETEFSYGSRVKKQLKFGEKGSPNKKIAPSTPGAARPNSVGIIDISDSDDEPDATHNNMHVLDIKESDMLYGKADCAPALSSVRDELAASDNLKTTLLDQSDEEDMNCYKGNFPSILTPKRKRASNVVASDSESSDDDKVPISTLRRKLHQEENTNSHLYRDCVTGTDSMENFSESAARRPLVRLKKCEMKGRSERSSPSDSYRSSMRTNEDVEDDRSKEEGSESEGDSLGGFIVNSSDASDGDGASCSNDVSDGIDASKDDAVSSESRDVLDSDVDYDEIISRFHRNRGHSLRWEFEADMLAAFGKDFELCTKAVCALYRQQTSDEKVSKGTIYSNQRGFSQCDALRGTTLAEFLTDGDPKGDLIKSVEELRQFDPRGPELCRTLATHYSKQLFAIYKNKEDPFFLPS